MNDDAVNARLTEPWHPKLSPATPLWLRRIPRQDQLRSFFLRKIWYLLRDVQAIHTVIQHYPPILLMAVAALALGRMASATELPTSSEIAAGYRQNIASFGNTSVRLRVRNWRTPDYYDHCRKELEAINNADRKGNLQGSTRQRHMQRAMELRSLLTPLGDKDPVEPLLDKCQHLSVVAGNGHLFVMAPRGLANSDTYEFPVQLPASSDSLQADYTSTVLLSWSSAQAPPLWVWQGVGGNLQTGRMEGLVSEGTPQQYLGVRFPPQGRLSPQWGDSSCFSCFDNFFELVDGDSRAIGLEPIGGTDCIVVEAFKPSRSPLTHVYTAWIDPLSGFLPVRIEHAMHRTDGHQTIGERSQPLEVTIIHNIEPFEGAGFYPVDWETQVQSADLRPSPDGERQPGARYISALEDWSILELQHHIELPRDLSQIGFPSGTHVFDTSKGSFILVSPTDQQLDAAIKKPAISVPVPAPENIEQTSDQEIGDRRIGGGFTLSFVVLVNTIVAVGLLIFYIRSRGRRS